MKVFAITFGSLASAFAQQPAKTSDLHTPSSIAPQPTATTSGSLHLNETCSSSVARGLLYKPSLEPALSSFAVESPRALVLQGRNCTLTLPASLTDALEHAESSRSMWASELSSNAAAVSTDCGNGGPFTISMGYVCPDGYRVVGTAADKKPGTKTLPGVTGPTEIVVGANASKFGMRWDGMGLVLLAMAITIF